MVWIIIFLATFNIYASDMQSQIGHKNGIQVEISPGEMFEGVMRIWPYHSKNIDKFKQLAGKNITPYFFLHKIDDLRRSPNNIDVVEIYGNFVVVTDFGITSFLLWENGKHKIPLAIKGITIKHNDVKAKKMHILDQNIERKIYLTVEQIIVGVLVLALIAGGGIYYNRRVFNNLKQKKEREVQRLYWLERFEKVDQRESAEELFKERKQWRYFFEEDQLQDYFSVVEKHQYKKDWTEIELNEIKEVYRNLKEYI